VPLFPHAFIDDLRLQVDIVQVVQDYVPLKRAGTSYKGLCPFHSEKTPSFTVNREKGFFHCFGCGAGGDVFKFLELHEKIGFQDAVRQLAQRCGLAIPEAPADEQATTDAADREALLKVHEVAAAFYREQLNERGGARARQILKERGLDPTTIDRLGIGYAPAARDTLTRELSARGLAMPLILRSGLALEREQGGVVDRFRGRLMIPICRDTGSVVAFGGRAMTSDQQPKYLNSPETPIYSKGRILYGLHLTKGEIRRLGYAVLVEGYFDFAQALQGGVTAVVASCGTALTPQQAHLLRRFASKIVLSFDPDPAGQGAAARSSELLVTEGFQVNVALLPAGQDPDSFVRTQGGQAYKEALKGSRPYLDYLMEQSASRHDLGAAESRRQFLNDMLAVAARIPDAAARDQFADRLALKARVTEEVVRAEIRRAAVERRPMPADRELPGFGQVRQAEKGLIWALIHDPQAAREALALLEDADFETLATRHVLLVARSLQDLPAADVPPALLARLNTMESQIVAGIAAGSAAPAPAGDCARALQRLRLERRLAEVQREIDRLQETAGVAGDQQIEVLWRGKREIVQRIESLS
jgi:DNA primase